MVAASLSDPLRTLAPVLPFLPLYERLQTLARIVGENLRPAVYVVNGDGAAQRQVLSLRPPTNEGPLIIHDLRLTESGTAASSKIFLNVNGSEYFSQRGVRLLSLSNALNQPIVVWTDSEATFACEAGSGSYGTQVLYASGVHCSPRFAELVRRSGELWAEERVFTTATSGTQEIEVARNTLLEAIVMPTLSQTVTEMWIRVADVLLTPRTFTAEPVGLFSRGRGFGRGPQSAVAGLGVTPRINRSLKAGDSIRFRVATSGTVVLTAVGAQVYVG
jgi:hypothetical protein